MSLTPYSCGHVSDRVTVGTGVAHFIAIGMLLFPLFLLCGCRIIFDSGYFVDLALSFLERLILIQLQGLRKSMVRYVPYSRPYIQLKSFVGGIAASEKYGEGARGLTAAGTHRFKP